MTVGGGLRRWFGHLLVVVLCVGFVNLGFWQLRRAEERQLENQVLASRFEAEARPVEELVLGAAADVDSLRLRRAFARGEFQPQHEILVRSQVHEGAAGFHVVTPLLLDEGTALLVNRGWVPLQFDQVPSPVSPPTGEVLVEGWLELSQPSTADDSDPHMVRTVDIAQMQAAVPWRLQPVYLVDESGGGEGLPAPLHPPDLNDPGPHLIYAWQWFAFALIGVVGYGFLLRRARPKPRSVTRQGGGPDPQPP
ncbi:MAG TPA: SURF1 family protein [Acidimicrobiia bacterium]|nr:SURF1 family protein [Acidimicrobiia bacterium]